MPSISSLVNNLATDFSQFRFVAGADFRWSPQEKTVYYIKDSHDSASILHELAHAILQHANYESDINLLELERDAWTEASSQLGMRYGVDISEDTVQAALDTYRDWLHARSTCPNCQATGMQTAKHEYRCLSCRQKWRVNDARMCGLRRYKVSSHGRT